MHRHATCTIAAGAIVLGLSACASQQPAPSYKMTGAGLGGAAGSGIGYLIGKTVGGKDGAWLGALAGAATGALIGGVIGSYLDADDQKVAGQAMLRVLNAPAGEPASATWTSDHNPGVSGTVKVADTGYDSQGRQCKKLNHVVYAGGKEHVETKVSCQNPATGEWT